MNSVADRNCISGEQINYEIFPPSGSALRMFPCDLPIAYRDVSTSADAWAAWFGSVRAAEQASERLRSKWGSGISDAPGMPKLQRHARKSAPAFLILSAVFGNPEAGRILVAALGEEEYLRIAPSGARMRVLADQMLGAGASEAILHFCRTGNIFNIADQVVALFPVMKSVFDLGGFDRDTASSLILAGRLMQFAEAGKHSKQVLYQLQMLIFQGLAIQPLELQSLLIAASPYLSKSVFFSRVDIGDVTDRPSVMPVKPPALEEPNLFSAKLGVAVDAAIRYISSRSECSPGEMFVLHTEAMTVAKRQGNGGLSYMYSEFAWFMSISMLKARGVLAELKESLSGTGLEVSNATTQALLPCELPRFYATEADGLEIMSVFGEKMKALGSRADLETFLKDVAELKTIRAKFSEIAGTVASVNLQDGIEQLALLAESSKAALSRSTLAAANLEERLLALQSEVEEFTHQWATPDNVEQSVIADPAPVVCQSCVEAASKPAAESAAPPTKIDADYKDLLEVAQHEIDELKASLKKVHADAQRIRALPEKPSTHVHGLNADLVRRIALRDKLTPEDVLVYIENIAGPRVQILESAWRSARESQHFEQTTKMLELVDTLVFAYLDATLDGTPDTVAKELFSGRYSAHESQCVTSELRLKAMREFKVNGELRMFVRHLKVANGHGPVRGMRLYFDIIDGQVVIAYAGKHLEIKSSN